MASIHPADLDLPAHIAAELEAAHVPVDVPLIVAVSGGMDSCVLLEGLLRVGGTRTIHVAHLDHQLRPGSAADAAFVCELAARHRLPCTVGRVNVGEQAGLSDESVEMAARRCRRVFLKRVADRLAPGAWIILAHHAHDQAETVLFRLMRGSGGTGLAGMSGAKDRVLRPLLRLGRDKVRQYALQAGLQWREDETNHDIRPRRNRIRHQLLPLLARSHNPQIVAALNRAAELLGDEDDYLRQVTQKAATQVLLSSRTDRVVLESHKLAGYHIAIRRRVLRQILQEVAPKELASAECVSKLLELLHQGAGQMQQAGQSLRAQNTGTQLIIRHGAIVPWSMPVTCPGRIQLPGHLVIESRWCAAGEFEGLRRALDLHQVILDAGPTLGDLVLRSPHKGDRLRPLGMSGHRKKLSDCFVDAGWPRILREDAVVLSRVEDGEILWVAGLARSECHQVHDGSRTLMYLKYEVQEKVL